MARPATSGLIGVLIAFGAIVARAQQPAQPPTPPQTPPPAMLTLNDAMARALEANRTVMAARSARAIDVAGIGVARQRYNPEANVEYDHPETPHWAFTGSIPLDINNKRQRRIDVANATVAVTEAETARVTAEIRADVRRAYYQAVAATRRVDITQELETIATRARDAHKSASRPVRRRASRPCRPA